MNCTNFKHKIIFVMADYGGAFLWRQNCDCGVMADCIGANIADCFSNCVNWPNNWDIPQKLEHRFIQWQRNFERHSYDNPKFNWVAHFKEEDALVNELQNVLGWQKYIVRPTPWERRLLDRYGAS